MVPESHEVTRANARGQGRPCDPRDGLAGLSCFTLSLHCKGADSCTGSLVRAPATSLRRVALELFRAGYRVVMHDRSKPAHEARSSRVRTRYFTAQPPHLRRLALGLETFSVR